MHRVIVQEKTDRETGTIAVLDRICAVLLAMCPLLQHYVGPVYNAAISVLVLLVPYLLFRIMKSWKTFSMRQISLVMVLIVYHLFRVVNHGTSVTEAGQSAVVILYLLALVTGSIDRKWFFRAALVVSVAASVCLVIQYVAFYLFGFHIQMVPTTLLLKSADQWVLGAQTGLAGITGKIRDWYRPSAFFLEPSHAYLYLFPLLLIQLLKPKKRTEDYIVPCVVTAGLILSTSGMGIAVVVGAWGLFVALYNEETGTFQLKNVMRKRNKYCIGILLVLSVLACVFVPPVRRTVSRIFVASSGSTAISGRVSKALGLLADFDTKAWICGMADTIKGISFNMPGFADVIYRHGIIGMILSYEFYVKSVFKLPFSYSITAMVIIVTSFFSAHTHSTVGMLYFVAMLMTGYVLTSRKEEGKEEVVPYV